MFSDRAIQLVAESKIEMAIEAGEFDKLPGFGKPFDFDPMAYDPNWWIRRKIEQDNIYEYVRNGKKEQIQ